MKSGSPPRTTAAHKTQTKIQAWSSLIFHCRHSSFNPSEAPPWDSRPVSGAGVVHYHLLHRPRSVPTALGPAPLATPMLYHSSTTITSCCSMKMHSMLPGSVHNSWKLKASQFLHGQYTRWTCHLLGMFGMPWIGIYDSVFQFLPISSNFAQPLKRSGPTFYRPQSTTWSTLCEGDVLHCMRQMVVTPDTDWFSDPPQYSKTAHFRVAFYCGQPRAHLCNNHAV